MCRLKIQLFQFLTRIIWSKFWSQKKIRVFCVHENWSRKVFLTSSTNFSCFLKIPIFSKIILIYDFYFQRNANEASFFKTVRICRARRNCRKVATSAFWFSSTFEMSHRECRSFFVDSGAFSSSSRIHARNFQRNSSFRIRVVNFGDFFMSWAGCSSEKSWAWACYTWALAELELSLSWAGTSWAGAELCLLSWIWASWAWAY